MSRTRILRQEDPETTRLLAEGWVVAGESWGARLEAGEQDLPRLDALAAALPQGYRLCVLTADDAADIAALDRATHADYPIGAAVFHDAVDAAGARALTERGVVHGVRTASEELVAMTAAHDTGTLVETEFTAVHPAHRRRRLAVAVKAASVAAGVRAGHRRFGTGGAQVNAGSLAMNRAVGYDVTERWVTLVPPTATSGG
ncbi:acetyltransferase [Kytococcus sedentarius]|uniref:acetyltransferase n=1 Tax=Kytococcus sedentarius TaxID=1276 RepID=UPI0035BBE045